MNIQNILLAMEELKLWQKRKSNLQTDLPLLRKEVRIGVLNELKKIDTQIAYYQDLIRDMKKRYSPPTILELVKK